jgi:predicted membrane GTPase involved in stress response
MAVGSTIKHNHRQFLSKDRQNIEMRENMRERECALPFTKPARSIVGWRKQLMRLPKGLLWSPEQARAFASRTIPLPLISTTTSSSKKVGEILHK